MSKYYQIKITAFEAITAIRDEIQASETNRKMYTAVVGDKFDHKKFREMIAERSISYTDLQEYACIYEEVTKTNAVTENYSTCSCLYDCYAYYNDIFNGVSGLGICTEAYKGTLTYGFIKACAALMQCDIKYFFNETDDCDIEEKIDDKQLDNDFDEGTLIPQNYRRADNNTIMWINVWYLMEKENLSFTNLKDFIGIPSQFDEYELSNFEYYRYGTIQTIAWLLNVPRDFIAIDERYYYINELDSGRFINIYQTFMLDGSKIEIADELLSERLEVPIRIANYLKNGCHQINLNMAKRIAIICNVELEYIKSNKPVLKYDYWDNKYMDDTTFDRLCWHPVSEGTEKIINVWKEVNVKPEKSKSGIQISISKEDYFKQNTNKLMPQSINPLSKNEKLYSCPYNNNTQNPILFNGTDNPDTMSKEELSKLIDKCIDEMNNWQPKYFSDLGQEAVEELFDPLIDLNLM